MDSRLRFQQLARSPPSTQLGDGIRRSNGGPHSSVQYAAAAGGRHGGCAGAAQAKAARHQVTLPGRKHAIHPRGKSEQKRADSAEPGGRVQERVEGGGGVSKILSSSDEDGDGGVGQFPSELKPMQSKAGSGDESIPGHGVWERKTGGQWSRC